MTQAAAARALKIHPTTVWRWTRPGTLFEMIYRDRLQKIWEDHRSKASQVLSRVIEASMDLVKTMEVEKALKGSEIFLKATRTLPLHFPVCPADLTGQCPVRDMISPSNDPTDYERRWAGGDEVLIPGED